MLASLYRDLLQICQRVPHHDLGQTLVTYLRVHTHEDFPDVGTLTQDEDKVLGGDTTHKLDRAQVEHGLEKIRDLTLVLEAKHTVAVAEGILSTAILPALVVSRPHGLVFDKLAIVETETDEVGTGDGDEGQSPVVQLVNVHEAEPLEPVPDALKELKETVLVEGTTPQLQVLQLREVAQHAKATIRVLKHEEHLLDLRAVAARKDRRREK